MIWVNYLMKRNTVIIMSQSMNENPPYKKSLFHVYNLYIL